MLEHECPNTDNLTMLRNLGKWLGLGCEGKGMKESGRRASRKFNGDVDI